jgi:hypothetical protein
MPYKIIQESDFVAGQFPIKVEFTFEDDIAWTELLQGFVLFLRGCGFILPESVQATLIDEVTGVDLGQRIEDGLASVFNYDDEEEIISGAHDEDIAS